MALAYLLWKEIERGKKWKPSEKLHISPELIFLSTLRKESLTEGQQAVKPGLNVNNSNPDCKVVWQRVFDQESSTKNKGNGRLFYGRKREECWSGRLLRKGHRIYRLEQLIFQEKKKKNLRLSHRFRSKLPVARQRQKVRQNKANKHLWIQVASQPLLHPGWTGFKLLPKKVSPPLHFRG